MTWHLLGLGSLGSLTALRLLNAGENVHVLPRTPGQTLSRTLHRPGQPALTLTLPCARDEQINKLVLSVKGPDTCAALAPWRRQLATGAELVCLQNGFGTLDHLALPDDIRLLYAVSTDGVWRDADQIHVAAENTTLIGDGSQTPPAWLHTLQSGWPGLQWCADITRARWRKLAVNAVINPLTALYRCPNGDLLNTSERRARMATLASEVDQVAQHLFNDWPNDTLARSEEVARLTATNTSSMLADVLAGRATEISFINGFVLREADRLGLSLPEHPRLIEQVTALVD